MAGTILFRDRSAGAAGMAVPVLAAALGFVLPDPVWASAGVLCMVLAAMAGGMAAGSRWHHAAAFPGLVAWAIYTGGAFLASKPMPLGMGGQTAIFFILWSSSGLFLYRLDKMAARNRNAVQEIRAGEDRMAEMVREQEEELNRISKSLFLEIRAHIEAESRLRESEEKYRYLVHSLPEGIFILQEGKIIFFNPGLVELAGLDAEAVPGMDPEPFICKPCEHSGGQSGALTYEKPDGSKIFIESQRVDIRFNESAAQLYTVRDITERVLAARDKIRLESELEKAKKMEALGLMAAGVAHDLNNVLAGVVSTPDLMLMELPDDERYRGFRETILTIKDSGKRASVIVDELLTLGKGGACAGEPIRLNGVVEDYLSSPEYHKSCEFHPRVRVDTRLDPGLPGMSGSCLHMRKVVMNLVSNAMEAIGGEGRISVSTQCVRLEERLLEGYEAPLSGEYVKLRVADSGPGIDPGDLERIFEPFYTKKILGRSGTGLGLSIVWNIVHDHQGCIQVKSSSEGTCFDLYFPAASALKDEHKPDKIYTLSDYTGNNESILVVDDEPNQLKITSNMLRRMGYRVASVPSGEAAVEYVAHGPVDLVILDMIMAPGIDGLETFTQLKAKLPGIRAVLASGYSKTRAVDDAQAMGAGEFLKKPFSLQTLGLAVKHELERH